MKQKKIQNDRKENEGKSQKLRMEVVSCFLIAGSCLLSWKNTTAELMALTDQGQNEVRPRRFPFLCGGCFSHYTRKRSCEQDSVRNLTDFDGKDQDCQYFKTLGYSQPKLKK